MFKRIAPFLYPLILFLIAGCASKAPIYSGIRYPATDKVKVIFQEKDVPPQCRVFAHIIAHTPAGLTGEQIATGITTFAKDNGADLLLIGISRRIPGKADKNFSFYSYGPSKDYLFKRDWMGWKYGYKDWDESGNVVGLGFANWSDNTSIFDFGVKVQAVLLRCQQP